MAKVNSKYRKISELCSRCLPCCHLKQKDKKRVEHINDSTCVEFKKSPQVEMEAGGTDFRAELKVPLKSVSRCRQCGLYLLNPTSSCGYCQILKRKYGGPRACACGRPFAFGKGECRRCLPNQRDFWTPVLCERCFTPAGFTSDQKGGEPLHCMMCRFVLGEKEYAGPQNVTTSL